MGSGRLQSLSQIPCLPQQGPQGAKSFGQAFSKACGSRAEPWALPAGSERLQGGCKNGRACAKGNGLCGGRPLRRLRATPPLSGEARPKCRLRRLAVGGCFAALWRDGLRVLAGAYQRSAPAGEPLRRLRASLRERALRATSPFRGGRPKSRLRRLAVGLLRSPLEGRLAGSGWCLLLAVSLQAVGR